MRAALVTLVVLTALMLAACAQECIIDPGFATGAVASSEVAFAKTANGTVLDGNTPFLFNSTTTQTITVSTGTDFSIWLNCTGNLTSARYEISPGAGLWKNGSVLMSPCLNNLSVYEPTEKAFNHIRFSLHGGNNPNGTVANVTLLVSRK